MTSASIRWVTALCVALAACAGDGSSNGATALDSGADGAATGGSNGGSTNGGASTAGSNGGGLDGGATTGPVGISDAGTFPFPVNDAGMVLCGQDVCACADGIDDPNDADTLIDGLDPECTGPFDDDENTFATGIPGDNRDPKWQDCFFDGNSGSGGGDCRCATECILEGKNCVKTCQTPDACLEYCEARTPNGCDCFGCCEVYTDADTSVFVLIGGACSLDTIGDTTACPRCMQQTECVNDCGDCELCLGRDPADLEGCLPDGGTPGGGTTGTPNPPPTYTCDNGEDVCTTSSNCSAGFFCQLGCCLPYVLE